METTEKNLSPSESLAIIQNMISAAKNNLTDDGFHFFQIQLAPEALIRRGGIVKAVAQNYFTISERRTNNFADNLRATGIHQQ